MTHEIELVQAAMDGSTAAFEQIVIKYQSLVCAITFSGTGRVDISEELAQETFLSAWKNLRQLSDPKGFRPWLCTIARNMLSTYYRKKRPVPLDPADIADLSDQSPTPTDNLISQEENIMLEKAIMQMPAEYREPLVMFYRQDQSTREVALSLGLKESTVRMRLHRARQMLREEIATRLEHALEKTAPNKAFTKAVMLAVGGTILGAAAGANAATAATNASATGATVGVSAVMSTVTAKVVAAVAVVAIAIGAVLTYKLMSTPSPELTIPQTEVIAQEQSDEQVVIRQQITEGADGEAAALVTPLAVTNRAEMNKSSDPGTETVKQTDKPNPAAPETDAAPEESDGKILVGGIVQSEEGLPIADVDVQLLWHVMRGMPMLDSEEAVTDANGKWQCRITGESEDVSIRLKHPEYLERHSDYRPSFDDLAEQSVVLTMNKGLQLSGLVRDRQGNPVSNALIMPPNSITRTDAVHGIQDSAKSTRTDVNGYFILKAVKPGPQNIAVDAEGYGPTFVSLDMTPDTSSLEIIMDAGQTLSGIVTDVDGKPLSGVKIKIDHWNDLNKDERDYWPKQFKMLRRQTITDASGQYMIEHLPRAGEVEISYSLKKSGLLTTYIRNEMTRNTIKNITLFPIPTITGTVVDGDSGKPIPEFEVAADCTWDPNSTQICNSNVRKVTSPEGRFSRTKSNFCAHELPYPGYMAVRISAKGYHPIQSPWMQVGQDFSPITIRLRKARTLRSRLFYSDKTPAANTDVILVEPGSWVKVINGKIAEGFTNSEFSTIQTEPNGYFEFSEPASPTKILVLDYDEYLVADTNDLQDKLRMTPWSYVTGTVDSDDELNSNVIVEIKPEYDPNKQIRWMSRQTTNADGQFEFFYIPAIPQKISYGSGNSNTPNKSLEIKPGPNEELQLRLDNKQSEPPIPDSEMP